MSRLLVVSLLLGGSVLTLPLVAQEAAPPATNASAVAAPATNTLEATGTNAVATADTAAGEQTEKELTAFDEWIENVKKGGRTMIFIGLLSVLGLAAALERFVNLRRNRIVPDGFSNEVVALWKSGKFDEVAALCKKSRSALARVVETLLEHRTNADIGHVKMFAEDKAGRELRLENRKAHMLSVVATIAPLLGLFGTVVGLLGAFNTVATVGEMGDPSIMANDIAKALVTTVAGLSVAMPALFFHHLFRNQINLFGVLLEEEVSDLVNLLFIKAARPDA